MADNVAVTAGAGTTLATQDRSAVHFQQVIPVGGDLIANGQVNISNTAATIVAARANRVDVTILNRQTVSIFIGVATVTTANGFELAPGAALTLRTTALVQGITAAASPAADKVHYAETFD